MNVHGIDLRLTLERGQKYASFEVTTSWLETECTIPWWWLNQSCSSIFWGVGDFRGYTAIITCHWWCMHEIRRKQSKPLVVEKKINGGLLYLSGLRLKSISWETYDVLRFCRASLKPVWRHPCLFYAGVTRCSGGYKYAYAQAKNTCYIITARRKRWLPSQFRWMFRRRQDNTSIVPLILFRKFELTTVPLQCEIVSNAIKLAQILINPLTNPMLYLLMHTWRCFLAYGASIVDVILDSARYPTNGCKLT